MAELSIGVDLGGTKCLGVAIDATGAIVAEHRVPTPLGGEAVLDALAAVVTELRGRSGADGATVGVGAPGLVDRAGVLHAGANMPGILMLPIRAELEARLGVQVRVDNDATAAAWGEFVFGAARDVQSAVLVTQGTGIGGGIIDQGRLVRGANGFAGEIGHMVVDRSGPICPCGKRGCWERYASGSALGEIARGRRFDPGARVLELAGGVVDAIRGEHVTAAAEEGDHDALAIIEEFAWWVALGLANLAELCDPQMIVLGGGLADASGVLLAPTRAAFDSLVQATGHRPPIDIVVAALGAEAGAIGAAALGREPSAE